MKQLTVRSWTGKMEPRTVETDVAGELSSAESRGVAEGADEKAEKVAAAFGRLIQMLADNSQLTPQQVKHIAEGWQNDNIADVFL